MADRRKYGAYPGFRGYAASRFKRLSRDRQFEVMTRWFLHHYEDLPERDGREGESLGAPSLEPMNAIDEIQKEFGDVAGFDLMTEAVEALKAEGIPDWASTQEVKENKGLPSALPHALGVARPFVETGPIFSEGVLEAGIFEPGVFEEDPQPRPVDETTARREMLERLERLERLMEPMEAAIGLMGHNGPPGPIEDPSLPEREPNITEPPLTSRDIEAVKASIQEVKEQAGSAEPSVVAAEQSQGILTRAWKQICRWIEVGGDEAAKSIGKRIGDAVFVTVVANSVNWTQIGQAMHDSAVSISAWIQTINLP